MTTADLSCGCTLLGKCTTRATQEDGLCDECREMAQAFVAGVDDPQLLHATAGTVHITMSGVTLTSSSPTP